MKESFNLLEEKGTLTNTTIFHSFHTAHQRLRGASFQTTHDITQERVEKKKHSRSTQNNKERLPPTHVYVACDDNELYKCFLIQIVRSKSVQANFSGFKEAGKCYEKTMLEICVEHVLGCDFVCSYRNKIKLYSKK